MTIRLRRTICVFTSAVMLVGLNGCRHKNCRSQSCQIGSQYETYESTPHHPATTYEYYGPGPILPAPGSGLSESELPPPVPESELAPRPNTGLIQPNITAPIVPPAPMPAVIPVEPTTPKAVEPADEDSPFKGAMRSTREKVSRMFRTPHTSSTRTPAHRSSPTTNNVRPFSSFPRQAAVPAARTSPQPTVSLTTPQPVPNTAATVPVTRHAAQTSFSKRELVTDDFVSPFANGGETAADSESLDLTDPNGRDTDSIEIPEWSSVTARHPVTALPQQAAREATSMRPIPVGSWVRITPRVDVSDDADTSEFNETDRNIPEPKRLDSSGPTLAPSLSN
ncbi:MAG: hypothetical protein HZA46_04560 [Planctomycetales bacterium]|nr:hypothetical protein [Planctomycetales bacterium]